MHIDQKKGLTWLYPDGLTIICVPGYANLVSCDVIMSGSQFQLSGKQIYVISWPINSDHHFKAKNESFFKEKHRRRATPPILMNAASNGRVIPIRISVQSALRWMDIPHLHSGHIRFIRTFERILKVQTLHERD